MTEFKYFLNRQGVRGPQGPQGEKGFSPDISVEKDTLSEYVLRITNEGGYFLTANLREHKEDRGGTYIRYDRATGVMYAGDADYASTEKYGIVRLAREEDLLTQEESLAVSSAILNGYLEKYYLNKVNGDAVTGDVYFRGRTGFTKPILVDGLKGDNEKQYLTRSDSSTAIGSLTIPDDDSRLTQGSKEIAYTSDLTNFVTNTTLNSAISNLVTLDTNQTITGNKTFTGLNSFKRSLNIADYLILDTKDNQTPGIAIGSASALFPILTPTNDGFTLGHFDKTATFGGDVKLSDGNFVLGQGSVTAGDNISITKTSKGIQISSTGGGAGDVTLAGDNSFTGNNTFDGVSTFNGDTWVNSLKVGTSLTNQQDKKFLAQGNITAGSDNLVIADTTDGVQITCNAPTNAQIEALQRLINDLSTKVDNLTTRLNNLEEVIDGGVAGSIYPADPQKIDADPVVDNAINTGETSGSVNITVEDN